MSTGGFIGKMLSGMGPGLLSGLGDALQGDGGKQVDADTHVGQAPDPKDSATAKPNSFKHGGVVQKTGVALVHKGETVIPNHMHDVSLHRALSHLNKGGLHRALGIDPDKDIPKDKLASAMKSDNPHLQHMALMAHTMESWHKK